MSRGRLVAASGLVAVTYTNRDPAADALAVLRYVYERAAELGVDPDRIAIWVCSGNVPTALSALLVGADVPVDLRSRRCAAPDRASADDGAAPGSMNAAAFPLDPACAVAPPCDPVCDTTRSASRR